MTIISILKTVFITLNNHFEWIKPWNMVLLGVNIVITFVIFAIEITKKQEVVKAVRAYYYLYNYIYKNLDADYPPIQNKTFVEFYYIVLEIGYIVKLVSEICSWIDYFKFCDKCGCKCENCQDRNCVKCKGEMCVIKGVDCSCKNEKDEKSSIMCIQTVFLALLVIVMGLPKYSSPIIGSHIIILEPAILNTFNSYLSCP